MPGFNIKPYTINKLSFNFLGVQGRVIEGKSWSETNISGGGGGGAILNGMGSTTINPIKTTVTTYNEIWLEVEKGKEMDFSVLNVRFPIRPGHCVSIILGERQGGEGTYPVLLINHTTGAKTVVLDNIGYMLGKVSLLSDPVVFVISLVLGGAIGLLPGLIIGPFIGRRMHKKSLIKKITAHLETLAQDIHAIPSIEESSSSHDATEPVPA